MLFAPSGKGKKRAKKADFLPELPEKKAEVVVVALLGFPKKGLRFQIFQQAPNPPKFALASVGKSKAGGRPPEEREGTNLGVFVSVWLVMTPARCHFGCI